MKDLNNYIKELKLKCKIGIRYCAKCGTHEDENGELPCDCGRWKPKMTLDEAIKRIDERLKFGVKECKK